MDFFRLDTGRLLNLSHVVSVEASDARRSDKYVKLHMSNGSVYTLGPNDSKKVMVLIDSYTFEVVEREPVQLQLPFDPPAHEVN